MTKRQDLPPSCFGNKSATSVDVLGCVSCSSIFVIRDFYFFQCPTTSFCVCLVDRYCFCFKNALWVILPSFLAGGLNFLLTLFRRRRSFSMASLDFSAYSINGHCVSSKSILGVDQPTSSCRTLLATPTVIREQTFAF